jgi:hypothetical protein
MAKREEYEALLNTRNQSRRSKVQVLEPERVLVKTDHNTERLEYTPDQQCHWERQTQALP